MEFGCLYQHYIYFSRFWGDWLGQAFFWGSIKYINRGLISEKSPTVLTSKQRSPIFKNHIEASPRVSHKIFGSTNNLESPFHGISPGGKFNMYKRTDLLSILLFSWCITFSPNHHRLLPWICTNFIIDLYPSFILYSGPIQNPVNITLFEMGILNLESEDQIRSANCQINENPLKQGIN